jgi:hypothetical protein
MMPKLLTDSSITPPRRVIGTKGSAQPVAFAAIRIGGSGWQTLLMKMTGKGAKIRCLGRIASREKIGCLV